MILLNARSRSCWWHRKCQQNHSNQFFLFFEYWKPFAEKYLQVVLSGDDIEADQAERWGNLMWTSLELLKDIDRIQLVATRLKDRPTKSTK